VATDLIAVARTWSFWIASLSEAMKKVGSGKPLGLDCTDATCLHHPRAEEIRTPCGLLEPFNRYAMQTYRPIFIDKFSDQLHDLVGGCANLKSSPLERHHRTDKHSKCNSIGRKDSRK
jgi:hypothetical protein